MFDDYLQSIPAADRRALEHVIRLIHKKAPQAKPGLSYGLPAFRYHDRPLIGFSSNKYGLNIYPFDPRIISAVKPQLNGYEVSKGVVRFNAGKPVPDEVVLAMLNLRLDYLDSQSKKP